MKTLVSQRLVACRQQKPWFLLLPFSGRTTRTIVLARSSSCRWYRCYCNYASTGIAFSMRSSGWRRIATTTSLSFLLASSTTTTTNPTTVAALAVSPRRAHSTMTPKEETTTKTVQQQQHPENQEEVVVPLSKYIPSVLENSWIHQLSLETSENLKKSRRIAHDENNDENRTKRPVFNGHYVIVKPTGLQHPVRLVLYSPQVAHDLLKLSKAQVDSDEFVEWMSGNAVFGGQEAVAWATPYALSIMGTRYTNNCPYGTGVGYGDGRAISIAEFNGYELQLKGGGTTPFCRGADGRAVLRSSIREFLASEAMHHLNIRTTRALSLVMSETETVHRPWYSDDARMKLPTMEDERLANYSETQKRQLLQQLRNQKVDPNIMITEPCAITCRVASSFVRVGHLDLFARRVYAQLVSDDDEDSNDTNFDTSTMEWKELTDMVWHACYREFRDDAYTPFYDDKDIASAATVLLEQSADRISTMVAEWVRVGFVQGNFNADNCLISGSTMDYGPFGFMEEYNPVFAKWTGSGQHFGFLNQPNAGFVNYQVLVESVVPVIIAAKNEGTDRDTLIVDFMEKAQALFQGKMDETFRVKLGLSKDNEAGDALWMTSLEPLMRQSRVDWTLFWRQLTYVAQKYENDGDSTDYEGMMQVLLGRSDSDTSNDVSPFYEPLSPELHSQYVAWIKQWREELNIEGASGVGERMGLVNPKYILREWMLVDAYTAASKGDESILKSLFELIQNPYDEGTPEQERLYYTRAHDAALTAGGTAFMS